jgi:hypothetical protein
VVYLFGVGEKEGGKEGPLGPLCQKTVVFATTKAWMTPKDWSGIFGPPINLVGLKALYRMGYSLSYHSSSGPSWRSAKRYLEKRVKMATWESLVVGS